MNNDQTAIGNHFNFLIYGAAESSYKFIQTSGAGKWLPRGGDVRVVFIAVGGVGPGRGCAGTGRRGELREEGG